jgi:hypothetical protein
VFASLFTIIIISTYVVFGGITIGDQWFHQGRALLFMSGSFREASISHAESFYPPFQSALIGALTTLSGIPLVNSYASIAFLNAIPIFAFYYFFKIWVPRTFQKAGLLACTLFTLSAGFGWIYLFSTDQFQNIISPQSVLDTFVKMGRLDIVGTSNFVIPTGPDFSTGLIYIALPAGFVLLGLLRTNLSSRPISISLLIAVTIVGIISHYEFYIFVIIASILPIVFAMQQRNNVYFALVLSLSIVYLLDISAPGNYLSSLNIMGYPLLILTIILLCITWTIYLVSNYLHRILKSRSVLFESVAKLRRNRIFNSVTSLSIIFLIVYIYMVSIMVLSDLPLGIIDAHASEGNVPWYLYPMKLGIVGILGMAFILSYLYRKFEKEIFVFGIIIVVAIITGPYYSEYRFSKYVMVGMIGFASLMLYKILMYRFKIGIPRNIAIIGVVTVCSGLSIFMFIGFNSLILETHDFTDTLPRRHFPSTSELHLFELLYNKFNTDPDKFNIVSFLSEYNRWKDGVMSKIPSFAGLPYNKVHQSPLTLNASTIDALYNHLASSDIRYIIIPKDSIKAETILSEPIRFVLEHFKRMYEDDDYILLEVPLLVPPNHFSRAQIGIIYTESHDLTQDEISDTRLLQFDNETYDFDDDKSVTVQGDNMSQMLSLLGAKMDKGITIWSKEIPIEKRVNYMEARFRIVSETENKPNDVRIEWHEGNNRFYYVKISSSGLELYEILKDKQPKRILLKNAEMNKENLKDYTLKIQSLDDSIGIYLNNQLKIQVPKAPDNKNQTISKLGLTTNYNDVEFQPLKIGSLDDLYQDNERTTKYYNYYYPLSILALSNASYDSFSSSDSSVFTKKVILLSDSLLNDTVTFSQYMDYVLGGGKLIIANSENDFGTIFNQLFALNITAGEEKQFTNIALGQDQNIPSINVSGHVKTVNTIDLPNINTIASYRNNKNETIAPFIVSKNFSGGGKIYLLNVRPYFNAISNAPIDYFPSLSEVTKLLPVDFGHGPISHNILTPKKGFVGKMQISGLASINSTSLIFSDLHDYYEAYSLSASRLSIFNGSNNPIIFNNISIKDLKLTGDYLASIDIYGTFELPDPISDHDYFGIGMPSGFNMTIIPQSKGFANLEIMAQNKSSTEYIKLGNNSRLEFFGVKPPYPGKLVPVLVKEPEIKIDGQAIINDTYFDGFLNFRGGLDVGVPLNLRGHFETKFELVDNFEQPYRNTTKTKNVIYVQMPAMNGTSQEAIDQPKLPGDIHYKANEKGQDIPLQEILTSPSNIVAIISSVALTIILWRIIWPRKYSHM